MRQLRLEEVFKISGVPTVTFVPPSRFSAIKVALRTPGRGVVVEGPSGIGKSTSVTRALEETNLATKVTKLTSRVPADVEYISVLPELSEFGIVVVDDFHRLPEDVRMSLADLLKVLADREDEHSKLVIIGINRAGDSLISHAPDLANRIETIRFEVEPPAQIYAMISLGEQALNVEVVARDQVAEAANGSFYIAQLLSFELCLAAGVEETSAEPMVVNPSFTGVSRRVLERQEGRFGIAVRSFARGTKFRPSGRAPYLHILTWLREADTWSISLSDEIATHPNQRISVAQVVDKGYLANLIKSEGIVDLFHLDERTKVLSIEDPHLAFYLRNLDWAQFVKEVGFSGFSVEAEYDVALSFAGEDRAFAELLYDYLSDDELQVLYDLAEQDRILAEDIERYLAPIYESRTRFVVAVLGERYGQKRWTIMESDRFKHRIERGEVIPVWSTAVPVSAFDKTRDIGAMRFDPNGDLQAQARVVAGVVARKIASDNQLKFGTAARSGPDDHSGAPTR